MAETSWYHALLVALFAGLMVGVYVWVQIATMANYGMTADVAAAMSPLGTLIAAAIASVAGLQVAEKAKKAFVERKNLDTMALIKQEQIRAASNLAASTDPVIQKVAQGKLESLLSPTYSASPPG